MEQIPDWVFVSQLNTFNLFWGFPFLICAPEIYVKEGRKEIFYLTTLSTHFYLCQMPG